MAPIAATQDQPPDRGEPVGLDVAALRPVVERVTRLAGGAAGTTLAYVVLQVEGQAWRSGFDGAPEMFEPPRGPGPALCPDGDQTSRDQAFWREDLRLSHPDHPWVEGPPGLRFHAGAPILSSDGVRLGTLCVAGPEPRPRDEALIETLVDLAGLLAETVHSGRRRRVDAVARGEAVAERVLKETIMRGAPVALGMVDRDLRYVYVNDRWLQDKGLTTDQAIGRRLPELFPTTFADHGDIYQRALAGETVRSDRVKVPAPGRPERWLSAEIVPWRDDDGEIAGLITLSHDISHVVESLDRAVRSEQRLKLALEIADVMVYELDYRARTLKVDGAADTFFGGALSYDELARDIWSTVHPEDREAAMATWERHAREGTPFRTEYRMNTPDGREVWAFSAAELIRGEDGRVDGLLGVLNNITVRKQSEAATERARVAAETANRAKSEFLANMSHEIRTPLNGVMGVAAALARTDLDPAQAEMTDLILTSGQTLEAILADILDLARIESGRLELKAEPFDLAACLRSAAALFQPGAAQKGLGFDLDIPPEVAGAFVGDAVRLRQIISNLLSNAVKFTSAGGVSLRATATPDGPRARLSLTVSDSGIGFSPEVKARLFERFEQADGSITRSFGGTGLGLAISRALAQAMGGQLDAESEPGRGSTFTLTLPLDRATAEPAVERPDPAAPAGDGRAARVLLAEDHAINRKVIELLLGPLGVELTSVENGARAVEAAATGGFDLILMDMQMPVMDGLAATRLIRVAERAAARRPTPVWALSANALPEHVAASLAAGADGHLSKPVSARALYGVLATACAARDGPDAARSA